MINTGFNKKLFALLLNMARGDRTLRQYAIQCDISYMQLNKLSRCAQENPPRPSLLYKLSAHSASEVTEADFMFAAGYKDDSILPVDPLAEKIKALPPRKREAAEAFVDFLATQD